jgi:hypothetical protein
MYGGVAVDRASGISGCGIARAVPTHSFIDLSGDANRASVRRD